MKHVFISTEETTQLILVPENETETMLLNKLINNEEVSVNISRDPISIPGLSSKSSITLSNTTK